MDGVHDRNICLVFVHSGYVFGGYTPNFSPVIKDGKYLKRYERYLKCRDCLGLHSVGAKRE